MRALVMLTVVVALLGPARAQEAASPSPEGAVFTAQGVQTPQLNEPTGSEVEAGQPAPSAPWALPVEVDAQVKIRKVYEFLNDPKKTSAGASKGLAYEFKYFDHGAITSAQQRSRKGQYFVVTWSNGGAADDYVLRLDYRQAASRDRVNTLEIAYKQARGTFKGTFSVTGDDYYEFGDVHSWRISLVRGGRIVAQEQSFVW